MGESRPGRFMPRRCSVVREELNDQVRPYRMQALNKTSVCRANQVLIFKQAERPSQVYVAEGLAQRAYRKSSIVCSCDWPAAEGRDFQRDVHPA